VLVTGAKGYLVDIPLAPKPTALPPWVAWLVGSLLVLSVSIWFFWKRPRKSRASEHRSKRMAGYLGSVPKNSH
jgi:hypothetical protein